MVNYVLQTDLLNYVGILGLLLFSMAGNFGFSCLVRFCSSGDGLDFYFLFLYHDCYLLSYKLRLIEEYLYF